MLAMITLIVLETISIIILCLLLGRALRNVKTMKAALSDTLETVEKLIGSHGNLLKTFKGMTGDYGRDLCLHFDELRKFIVEERALGTPDAHLLNQVVEFLEKMGTHAATTAVISDLDIDVSKDPRHKDK